MGMKKKILVVDDEENIVNIVKFNLTKAGYDVTVAHDGMEALQKVKMDKPDLIVCDVMMPKLDGFGVLKELKAGAETETIPFIMLTAKGTSKDVLDGWKGGVHNYLVKPFKAAELLATVKAIFEFEG